MGTSVYTSGNRHVDVQVENMLYYASKLVTVIYVLYIV
jgi:hypothetical protein